MRFLEFRIQNFKGIKEATIKLGGTIPSIHTLVGLNESGKTTILEAINMFQPDVEGMHAIAQQQNLLEEKDHLIPKSRRADFTDEIRVEAMVELTEVDVDGLAAHLREALSVDLDKPSINRSFRICKILKYDNSRFKSEGSTWAIKPMVKRPRARGTLECKPGSEEWKATIAFIRMRLPRIIYFPNFLFEFPDRILVSGELTGASDVERRTNKYFSSIIADALASLSPALDLNRHIVDRVLQTKPSEPFSAFMGFWFSSSEAESVTDVLEKLGQKISQEIFGRWRQVLGKEISNSDIEISSAIDCNLKNREREVYLTFKIKQGRSRYKVSERSLGFRWFFCFLLFTRFARGMHEGQSTVFLFDEPASNLHSKAQAKLLDSFEVIAGRNNTLIFSTHSHHMINPLWLENAHVVSNGLDTETELIGQFDSGSEMINITVQPYKTFVGQNPEKSHYFQPILDRIDYAPSKLEAVNSGVLVEGKSDYYILNYFKKNFNPDSRIDFVPVNGSSNARALLSLYLGWCRSFILLLDSDKEGKSNGRAYLDALPISEANLVFYDSIFEIRGNPPTEIEDLLSGPVKERIALSFGTARATKAQIQKAFASALVGKGGIELDEESIRNFENLMKVLEDRLSQLHRPM
jgi:hypothetical protein